MNKTLAADRAGVSSLLGDVARRAAAYLTEGTRRRVSPALSAITGLSELSGPLPASPSAAADVLDLLDRVGSPATVTSTAGRYFGFVTGGTVPASLAAGWLAAAWDQNTSLRVMSPAGASFEDRALEWVSDILSLPAGSGGALVTGATMANFTGLAAARHALLERAGWNAEDDGLFAAPPLTVVVGDEAHVSLLKALGLLGLGRKRVHRVPVDSQGRMRADALPVLHERTIICLQAGNVNTGAFDPADEVCRRAHDAGAWVHVDGAFGLWAAASPRRRHLVEGFSGADSWATDAHKWPNVGYDCGIALVRDVESLRSAMALSSAYFVPGDRREPSQFTPEMSRRARGVELWATLQSLGREGLADLIDRTCDHAARFAEGLRALRIRDSQRRGHQSGAGVVRRAGDDADRHRAGSTRGCLLVRWNRVAGTDGNAHQRIVVGDDGRRRRGESGVDSTCGCRERVVSGVTRVLAAPRREAGDEGGNWSTGGSCRSFRGGGEAMLAGLSRAPAALAIGRRARGSMAHPGGRDLPDRVRRGRRCRAGCGRLPADEHAGVGQDPVCRRFSSRCRVRTEPDSARSSSSTCRRRPAVSGAQPFISTPATSGTLPTEPT